MFVVDANVLIEAKNRYYAFDIAPGFWTWLERAHALDLVCSIDAVRDELLAGDDELATWAEQHRRFFSPLDQRSVDQFSALTAWVNSRDYVPSARSAFTGSDADYLLVAFAGAHGHVVVTHEQPSPEGRKRVKIPDACAAMGVSTIDTFGMLRGTEARLVLADEAVGDQRSASPTIPGLEF